MGAPWTSAAEKVKPTVDAYTVALPWYEREDFERLWDSRMTRPRCRRIMTTGTPLQRGSSTNDWLVEGRLEIVTVKPDEFLSWLDAQGFRIRPPHA